MARLSHPQHKSADDVSRVAGWVKKLDTDAIADRHNIPENMIPAVMLFESQGKSDAQSNLKEPWHSCFGLMQVKPGTAADQGQIPRGLSYAQGGAYLKQHPEKNVEAGAGHLRLVAEYLHRYNERQQAAGRGLSYDIIDKAGHLTDGGRALTLAGYNWGHGNVDNLIRNRGDAWYKGLPAETHNYVLNIMNQMGLGSTMENIAQGMSPDRTDIKHPVIREKAIAPVAPEPNYPFDASFWSKVQVIDNKFARDGVEAISTGLQQDASVMRVIQNRLGVPVTGIFDAATTQAWGQHEKNIASVVQGAVADGHISIREIGALPSQAAPAKAAPNIPSERS